MDSFSSFFLSSFSNPNCIPCPTTSLRPFTHCCFVITSSLKIENKSKITSANKRTSPKLLKKRNPASLLVSLLNAVDEHINMFIDPPLRPSVDPRHVLADNFAPVDELPPTDCEVIHGSLPPCLNGAYIRNGPNPQFFPRGPHHLFDGDGMLHAIRISNGRATLCSRYVKTYKYATERDVGYAVFPKIFSSFNSLIAATARGMVTAARILAGQFNTSNGSGVVNTSLGFFGGSLYALCESDLPYRLTLASDGDVVTVGRHDFDGELIRNMTAHPKVDPDTGEAFAFRYGPMRPFLTFFRFDASGNKQQDVPIFSMACPSFVHDFAITEKHAIFPDNQIGINPMDMILGKGSAVGANLAKVPRLGVIPRYAKDESEMRWFNVPGYNVLHVVNAWDDGDRVVMVAPNILSIEHTLERTDLTHLSMEKVIINLKTGVVWRHPVSTRSLDFGVINSAYLGKKNKYVYAAVGTPMPKVSGVVKLDLSVSEEDRCECIVASRMYGPRCYGGEPFFVAREPDNPETDEDDGYLVSHVHDESTRESKFLVMDAKSATLNIVAALKLPGRVPYGFHGIFVRASELSKAPKTA